MSSNLHPRTPWKASTAQKAVHLLKGQLFDYGVFSFEWPQDLDSGIDVVAFATLMDEDPKNDGMATGFIAGFQSKGTAKASKGTPKSSVRTGKHARYWMSATFPVFVVEVDTARDQILIEDVGSIRDIYSLVARYNMELKSIPTDVLLRDVIADVRLRMFAHALAPWISSKLRARPLAHKDPARGLNTQSAWSLLDYTAGPDSSFPIAKSWDEIRQYFILLSYLLHDAVCRQQLGEDLEDGLSPEATAVLTGQYDDLFTDDDFDLTDIDSSSGREIELPNTGAVRLLAGSIELFRRFPSMEPSRKAFHSTERLADRFRKAREGTENDTNNGILKNQMEYYDFKDPHFGLLREDLDASVETIVSLWDYSAQTQGFTTKELAERLLSIGSYLQFSRTTLDILERVSNGASLQEGLRSSVLEWASKNIYINHWTDAIQHSSPNPASPDGSSIDFSPALSYEEYLRSRKASLDVSPDN